jgi:drug/metabolite transporter (DMT)-like permease
VIGIVFIALDPGEKVEEGGGSNIVDDDKPPDYWVLIALICANAYAFYNIFIKKGSSSIDPILGGKKLIPIDAEPPFTILLNLIFIY